MVCKRSPLFIYCTCNAAGFVVKYRYRKEERKERMLVMKKVFKYLLIFIAVALIGFSIWHFTDSATINEGGKAVDVSFADSWQLRSSLLLHSTGGYEYRCGFAPDYSVEMGGLTYCLAKDDCGAVYISELDLYYEISHENHARLDAVLNKYLTR